MAWLVLLISCEFDLLLDPPQYTTARRVDAPGGLVEFRSNRSNLSMFYHRKPEGLPSRLIELILDSICCCTKFSPTHFPVEILLERVFVDRFIPALKTNMDRG